MFAALPGNDILQFERTTLGMLGLSSNAELDRIARNKLKRSPGSYRWYDSLRISVISPADLAISRSSESERE